MSLEGAKFICLDNAGNHGKIVLAKGRKFTMGYYVSCDFVLVDERAKGVHCEIECDAFGRVTIRNLSPDKPILVNGSLMEIKQTLLNNSKLSILDKEYLWVFARTSSNEFEDILIHSVSTPEKLTGVPEQPPNSCPDYKLHRDVPKRLTVHNFVYCIQSDEEGNTSSESNDDNANDNTQEKQIESETVQKTQSEDSTNEDKALDTVNEIVRRSKTPEHRNETDLLITPKMNLINCTRDKENKSTHKKTKQLTMCHQSDVVITSFSPRQTGFKIEKSFTKIVKPRVLLAPLTPQSVYSTPTSDMNNESERDLITFYTPSTSRKGTGNKTGIATAPTSTLKNSSMHLIDLTTPNKLLSTSPYLKSAFKAATKKNIAHSIDKCGMKLSSEEHFGLSALPNTPVIIEESNCPSKTPNFVISVNSSTDLSSVIEVTSDGSNVGITPSSATGLNTPLKAQTRTGVCTPKRTPQSLIKRALLTSAKNQKAALRKDTHISTTPRKEHINRIPTRTDLVLKTPATPQTVPGELSKSEFPRRQSMSTPTRKGIMSSSRHLDNSFSTKHFRLDSPSTSKISSRRSSINPISVARALPTSTPLSVKNRAACKTSPLHKVRKSSGGVPLSSHISKTLKLTASTSKITSIKEKSPQRLMSDRLVTRARKSLCVTNISHRSHNMVVVARTSTETGPSSVLQDRKLQSAKKLEQKTLLTADERPIDTNEVDGLNRTFVIDSDEDDTTEIKDQKVIPTDTTFSPIKGPIETEKSSQRMRIKEHQTIEIPVDVEEIPDLSNKSNQLKCEDKHHNANEAEISLVEESQNKADDNKENNAPFPDSEIVKSIVTEECFAEIISNSKGQHAVTNTAENSDGLRQPSPTELQENFAVSVAKVVAEENVIDFLPTINQEIHKNVAETGFGEESTTEISQTSYRKDGQHEGESIKEETLNKRDNCSKPDLQENYASNKQQSTQDEINNQIVKEADLIEKAEQKQSFDAQEVKNKFELKADQHKTHEYKPIVEDITLEGSLIEKETKETEFMNVSSRQLCEGNALESSLIEESVKNDEIKEENKIKVIKETTDKEALAASTKVCEILEPTASIWQEKMEDKTEIQQLKTKTCQEKTTTAVDETTEVEKSDLLDQVGAAIQPPQVTQFQPSESTEVVDKNEGEIAQTTTETTEDVSQRETPSCTTAENRSGNELEDTNKLLEEIEDVLNKSDEIKQKHLNELEKQSYKSGTNLPEKCENEQLLKGNIETVTERPVCSDSANKFPELGEHVSYDENRQIVSDRDSPKQTKKLIDEQDQNEQMQEIKSTEVHFDNRTIDGSKSSNANVIELENTSFKESPTLCSHNKSKTKASTNADQIEIIDLEEKGNIIFEADDNRSEKEITAETKGNHQLEARSTETKEPTIADQIEIIDSEEKEYNSSKREKSDGSNLEKAAPKGSEQLETCSLENIFDEKTASKGHQNDAEIGDSKELKIIRKQIENATIFTPRRSTRRASQSTETPQPSAELSFTPRRSTRRSSFSAQSTSTSYTPAKRITRLASLSVDTEAILTPKPITKRRLSISVDDEPEPSTSKTQRAKTPLKQLEQCAVILEDIQTSRDKTARKQAEVVDAILEELEPCEENKNESNTSLAADIFQNELSCANENQKGVEDSLQTQELIKLAITPNEKKVKVTPEKEMVNDTLVVREKETNFKELAIFPQQQQDIDVDPNVNSEAMEDNAGSPIGKAADANSTQSKVGLQDICASSTETHEVEKMVPEENPKALKTPRAWEDEEGISQKVADSVEMAADELTKTSEDIETKEISTSATKKCFTFNADSPKTLHMTNAPAQTLPLDGVDDGDESDKLSLEENSPKMSEEQFTPASTHEQQTKIGCDAPKTPLMAGIRKLLKTPKGTEQTPRLGGIRDLLRTPKEHLEDEAEEIEKFAGVGLLIKTPAPNISRTAKPKANKHVTIVADSPQTPLRAAKKNVTTPRLANIRNLLRTANTNDAIEEEFEKLPPVPEIMKISNVNTIEEVPSTSRKGAQELPESPKSCSTPQLKGLRELMHTPKRSSTPKLCGVKELLASTPLQGVQRLQHSAHIERICVSDHQKDNGLEKFLRTPTAKNIMIPSMPASAVIEKINDSIEISTEYDLNASNEVESANLEELFKTPVAARFIEHNASSYYGAEEVDPDETDEAVNHSVNKTLQDALNRPAEDAFDQLVGQESQIETPIRRVYTCKAVTSQSPFSAADVLSDLPKSDVEEWIETLDQADPPTILECDDEEIESDVVQQEILNSTTKTSGDDVSVLGYSLSEKTEQLSSSSNELVIPETCAKVYLTEPTLGNKSTASLTGTELEDPLSNADSKQQDNASRRLLSGGDAEISGINLLDQTIESIPDEPSFLEVQLPLEESSMFDEPLIVSDDSETENTLNKTNNRDILKDEGNDLSEPLLLSDSEDLDLSAQVETNATLTTKHKHRIKSTNVENLQTSTLDINSEEKSMLEELPNINVALAEDPLERKETADVSQNEWENNETSEDIQQESVGKSASTPTFEEEKSFANEEEEEVTTLNIADNNNFQYVESDNTEMLEVNVTSEITELLEISSTSQLDESNKDIDVEIEAAERHTDHKGAKEITIEQTEAKSTEAENIFVDKSVAEIGEETNILNEERTERKRNVELKKEIDNIFMDNSSIDESFADEAINKENESEMSELVIESVSKNGSQVISFSLKPDNGADECNESAPCFVNKEVNDVLVDDVTEVKKEEGSDCILVSEESTESNVQQNKCEKSEEISQLLQHQLDNESPVSFEIAIDSLDQKQTTETTTKDILIDTVEENICSLPFDILKCTNSTGLENNSKQDVSQDSPAAAECLPELLQSEIKSTLSNEVKLVDCEVRENENFIITERSPEHIQNATALKCLETLAEMPSAKLIDHADQFAHEFKPNEMKTAETENSIKYTECKSGALVDEKSSTSLKEENINTSSSTSTSAISLDFIKYDFEIKIADSRKIIKEPIEDELEELEQSSNPQEISEIRTPGEECERKVYDSGQTSFKIENIHTTSLKVDSRKQQEAAPEETVIESKKLEEIKAEEVEGLIVDGNEKLSSIITTEIVSDDPTSSSKIFEEKQTMPEIIIIDDRSSNNTPIGEVIVFHNEATEETELPLIAQEECNIQEHKSSLGELDAEERANNKADTDAEYAANECDTATAVELLSTENQSEVDTEKHQNVITETLAQETLARTAILEPETSTESKHQATNVYVMGDIVETKKTSAEPKELLEAATAKASTQDEGRKFRRTRRKHTPSESSQGSLYEEDNARAKMSRRKIRQTPVEEIVVGDIIYEAAESTLTPPNADEPNLETRKDLVDTVVPKDSSDQQLAETESVPEVQDRIQKRTRRKVNVSEAHETLLHDEKTSYNRAVRRKVQKTSTEKIETEENSELIVSTRAGKLDKKRNNAEGKTNSNINIIELYKEEVIESGQDLKQISKEESTPELVELNEKEEELSKMVVEQHQSIENPKQLDKRDEATKLFLAEADVEVPTTSGKGRQKMQVLDEAGGSTTEINAQMESSTNEEPVQEMILNRDQDVDEKQTDKRKLEVKDNECIEICASHAQQLESVCDDLTVPEVDGSSSENLHLSDQQSDKQTTKPNVRRARMRKDHEEEEVANKQQLISVDKDEKSISCTQTRGRQKFAAMETEIVAPTKIRSSKRTHKTPLERSMSPRQQELACVQEQLIETVEKTPTTSIKLSKVQSRNQTSRTPLQTSISYAQEQTIENEKQLQSVQLVEEMLTGEPTGQLAVSQKESFGSLAAFHSSQENTIAAGEEPVDNLAFSAVSHESVKKRTKRTRLDSECSQGTIVEGKPGKKRERKQLKEIEKFPEDVKAIDDKTSMPQIRKDGNHNVEVEVHKDVVENSQRSTRRRKAVTHEPNVLHHEDVLKKSKRRGLERAQNEEQQSNTLSGTALLTEVKVTEDIRRSEEPSDHRASLQQEIPEKAIVMKRSRRKAILQDPQSANAETLAGPQGTSTATPDEYDYTEGIIGIKRRAGRKKRVEYNETEVIPTTSKRVNIASKMSENIEAISGKEEKQEEPIEPKSGNAELSKHMESTESTSSRSSIGEKKIEHQEQDHDMTMLTKKVEDTSVEKSDDFAVERIDDGCHDGNDAISDIQKPLEETKKGRGRRKKKETVGESEQTTSYLLETKYRGRGRTNSHDTIKDDKEDQAEDKLEKQQETKATANTEPQTPKRMLSATRRGRKHFEHITAESQEIDDTPGRRARNVPQRRAATAYHNYDETSDSEISTKTKKRPETVKQSPIATVTVVDINPSPFTPSLTLGTTARGRTRKPTAKVQQFLEEERAKAETPKKRALLAATTIGGLDSATPQRTPARRGRKASTIETEVESTPQASKGRSRRRPAPSNTKEDPIVESETVIEEKEIELQTSSPVVNRVKGARGGRKAKITEEKLQNADEPPAKKPPLEIENEKDNYSPVVETTTQPTRVAGRRNAAAAAKARIEEDALAAASIEPPKRARAKKATTKSTNTVLNTVETIDAALQSCETAKEEKTTDEKVFKNKSSSQTREHRLASASTIEGAEDVEDYIEAETKEKLTNKRARKAAVVTTTESPAVSVKRGRRAKPVEQVPDIETPAETHIGRGKGRGRKNVHFNECQLEEANSGPQNTNDVESTPVAASEPARKETRSRRK